VALPAALLPFSILLDKSVRLDRFADYLREGRPGHLTTYIPPCAALKTGRGRGLAKRSCWDWRNNPIRGGFVLTQYTVLRKGAFHGRTAAVRKIREMGFKRF